MPENEQMFQYHGFSGDCPAPAQVEETPQHPHLDPISTQQGMYCNYHKKICVEQVPPQKAEKYVDACKKCGHINGYHLDDCIAPKAEKYDRQNTKCHSRIDIGTKCNCDQFIAPPPKVAEGEDNCICHAWADNPKAPKDPQCPFHFPQAVEEAWRERFKEKFYSKEYGIGYSMSPQPTTASLVVQDFLASEIKAAHERGRLEMGVQASAIALEEIEEARRATIELFVEKVKHLADEGLVEIINPDLSKFAHQAKGYQQACADILTFADSLKTNHEK